MATDDGKLHIGKFFEQQDIFVTGGSGFIGKVLIEKILRCCPDVGNIYVLLRPKKGKDINGRLQDMLNVPLFRVLRAERPEALAKVIAVAGDCSQLNLGISPQDLRKIENVSIVYNSAASVRFDDYLRDAVLLNTRGTFEMMKLAQTLKNLKILVHVSTTYSNPHILTVEEQLYPPLADWRNTIKIAEEYSAETLNVLFPKYSNNQPNTYTFTKSLAEHVINDHRSLVPATIFRPSIVINSVEDPIPGWIDNFNGPVGLMVACGTGIMRTSHSDPDIVLDFVPVDIVVRAMLQATVKEALAHQESANKDRLEVYNCATSQLHTMSLGGIIEIGSHVIKENPYEMTLWTPGGSITRCKVWNFIRFATMHIMMALIVDSVLRLFNQKPMLLRLQRKIFAANLALHYFMNIRWDFKNAKLMALDHLVPDHDMDTFGFLKYTTIPTNEFVRIALRGAKEFLLHEKPESSRNARIRFKIMEIVQKGIQILGGLWLVYAVWGYLSPHILHVLSSIQ